MPTGYPQPGPAPTGYPQPGPPPSGYPAPGYGARPPGSPAQPYPPNSFPRVAGAPLPPPAYFAPPPGYRPPPRSGGGGVWLALGLVAALVLVGLVGLLGRGPDAGGDDDPGFAYEPEDGGNKDSGLENNVLFADQNIGLTEVACTYPQWSADYAQVKPYLEAAVACLDRMWQPVLRKANLTFSPPALQVIDRGDTPSTPCTGTTGSFAAFYCSVNKTIYMPLDNLQLDRFGASPVVTLNTLAHEYGHHVQALSGLSQARIAKVRASGGANSAAGLELSRRFELEAQCFSGMHLNASTTVPARDEQQAVQVEFRRGDQPGDTRDHGSTRNSGTWFEVGYEKNLTAQCNTWTAPASAVS